MKDKFNKVKKYNGLKEKDYKKIKKQISQNIKEIYKTIDSFAKDDFLQTRILIGENSDAPIRIGHSNVFVAFDYGVWVLLNDAEKTYCLQFFIDNICDELQISRRKVGLSVPNNLISNQASFKLTADKCEIDYRLVHDNHVLPEDFIHTIILKFIDMKRIEDSNALLKKNKSIEDYTVSDLESFLCRKEYYETPEILTIMPRYKKENQHILNLLNSLNRMCLFDINYKNSYLMQKISLYEYFNSQGYEKFCKYNALKNYGKVTDWDKFFKYILLEMYKNNRLNNSLSLKSENLKNDKTITY